MKWSLVDETTNEILGSYPDISAAQKDNELFFDGSCLTVLIVGEHKVTEIDVIQRMRENISCVNII